MYLLAIPAERSSRHWIRGLSSGDTYIVESLAYTWHLKPTDCMRSPRLRREKEKEGTKEIMKGRPSEIKGKGKKKFSWEPTEEELQGESDQLCQRLLISKVMGEWRIFEMRVCLNDGNYRVKGQKLMM